MKVAIIGTQGVPAKYGGFETMVDNILGENASPDIQYTVFCSSKDMKETPTEYKGAKLKYLPFKANGMQSVLYDGVSLFLSVRGYDAILVLGVSSGLFFPLFRLLNRKRLIVNVDGLEHKRAKWGWFTKLFLRLSEEMALRFSNIVVADNQGIVNYIRKRYKKKTVLITYGGDHVLRQVTENSQQEILKDLSLQKNQYSLSICRVEPENNCHLILEAFVRTGENIAFIGNWERSEYGRDLKKKYKDCDNITIIDPIYDLEVLYALRNNCKFYVHGHSAGGTNPSLVESMFFGCPVLAYDVIYNRVTTENSANYFRDITDLALLLVKDPSIYATNAKSMSEIAHRQYVWRSVAKQYENLYEPMFISNIYTITRILN